MVQAKRKQLANLRAMEDGSLWLWSPREDNDSYYGTFKAVADEAAFQLALKKILGITFLDSSFILRLGDVGKLLIKSIERKAIPYVEEIRAACQTQGKYKFDKIFDSHGNLLDYAEIKPLPNDPTLPKCYPVEFFSSERDVSATPLDLE
jgi:hypothetical protein